MKRFLTFAIAFALLLTPVSAIEIGGDDGSEISWDAYILEFFDKYSINPKTVTLGYYNTVTGEEHYHNGDKYMLGASIYKVPLNMHFAEMVYEGEMTMETEFYGRTYAEVQRLSIQFSDNTVSELMQEEFGTYADYRLALAKYLGVSGEEADDKYLGDNIFTARQMVSCLKLLYAEPERYPDVLGNMLAATPGAYLELYVEDYEVAQKYGFLDFNDHVYLNAVGIIYTEEPIIVTILSDNCRGGEVTLGRYAKAMCQYAELTVGGEVVTEATPEPTPETPETTPEVTPEPTPEQTAEPVPSTSLGEAPNVMPAITSEPVPVEAEPTVPDAGEGFDAMVLIYICLGVCAIAAVLGLIFRKKPIVICALAALAALCAAAYLAPKEEADGPEDTAATAAPVPQTKDGEPEEAVTSVTVTGESAQEIALLAEMTQLKLIDGTQSAEYEALFELSLALPECEVLYSAELGGGTISSSDTHFAVENPETGLDEVMETLAFFPKLESVDISKMPVENSQAQALMDAYPDLDVQFMVSFGKWCVSSEITCFSTLLTGFEKDKYGSEDFEPLMRYCTELVALDLGHNDIRDISLITNLPKLKVLILADNQNLSDLSPLSELTQLEYLEIFVNFAATDYSALSSLTKLRNLNLSYSFVDNADFLESMPLIERVWLRETRIPGAQQTIIREKYPDTQFLFYHAGEDSSTCGGWRTFDENVEIRRAFTNWEYVENFESWDNVTYREGAELTEVYPSLL